VCVCVCVCMLWEMHSVYSPLPIYLSIRYITNICHSHTPITQPTDKDGKPIKGDRSVADGLSIPLIVGAVRDLGTGDAAVDEGDEGSGGRVGLCVDVVVHPRVLEISSHEAFFKAQVGVILIGVFSVDMYIIVSIIMIQ
jgi:hypothetical protein